MRWPALALTLSLAVGAAGAQHTLTGELPRPGADSQPLVLIAGATGRTGQQVLAQLNDNPAYRIRAMAREPSAGKLRATGRVTWVSADVTRPWSLAAAMAGVSYVICAIGATERSGPNGPEFVDFGGVRNLAEAARVAGVRQFVLVSSMGVESGGGFVGWILNLIGGDVLEWKAKGEQALRDSGVPYTIVRPGGLRDDAGGAKGIRLQQGDKGMGSISRADVARVLVASLGRPDAINRTFEIRDDDALAPGQWVGQFTELHPD
jgi:uncharacterized protein YbjT (DUF2867 family)